MTLKLQPNMTQSARDIQICEDYWTYDHKSYYIEHVKAVCLKYNISSHDLFKEVGQCFAYLDDVRCVCCGYVCPVQVPADIPYMRSIENWCCEICEYTTWQEYQQNR